MRTACLIVLIAAASAALCHPTKPLNERSTELAWQAWLLIDQSNQSRGEVGPARRKITPKSVFVAPTFSPESLPACADGYRSDPMGRCVRIIKINESFHLDFLLQRLSQQFPPEEPAEAAAAAGPLQFNIPLEGERLLLNDTEVAIVVTPSSDSDAAAPTEMDVRRPGDKFDVGGVAAILRVKPESVEMTTIAELTTMGGEMTTTMMTTTTTTTMDTTTTTGDGEGTAATTMEGDAIFFQV